MKVTIIGKLNQSFKNIKYKNTLKDKIYLDRTICKIDHENGKTVKMVK